MHRFLVPPEQISNLGVTFPDKEWKHLRQVLRLHSGDEVIVFDGQGSRYRVLLTEQGGQIIEKLVSDTEPSLRVSLAQGLVKGDKMDLIIQKAVELGVHEIIPLAAEHSVVKIDPQDEKKHERWQRISEESCKQCERDLVPEVAKVHSFPQLIKKWGQRPVCFFYERLGQESPDLRQILAGYKTQGLEEVLVVIGPEGGFSPAEAELAASVGWTTCSLGPRILRAETAAITALSIIMYELADLN